MSIVEELIPFVECGSAVDCDTITKLLLIDPECVTPLTVCEALLQAVKQDASGNIFLDIPISLRISELHTTGENPVVLEDTVWDDVRTSVSTVRLGAVQPPTPTAYKGSLVLAFPTNANKSIEFVIEMPHSWKESTSLEFHCHWTIPTSGAGAGAENVKWDFTYSIANRDETFPAESTATATTDVQNIVLDTLITTDIITIDMTGFFLSCVILCSLTRDVAVANDYTDDAYLTHVDFHFQKDSLGSKEENVK